MLEVLSDETVRKFVQDALKITGDSVTVENRIVERWLDDRENHGMNERDEGYTDGYSAGLGESRD